MYVAQKGNRYYLSLVVYCFLMRLRGTKGKYIFAQLLGNGGKVITLFVYVVLVYFKD